MIAFSGQSSGRPRNPTRDKILRGPVVIEVAP
jgi:hypothetical protein